MPMKPCAHPGCSVLLNIGNTYCPRHHVLDKKERDQVSHIVRGDREYRKWYGRKAWRQGRRKNQLDREPLCAMCPDHSRQPATIADHVIPHNGDYGLFWFGELQSLCKSCHDGKKQRQEKRAHRGGAKVQKVKNIHRRG